MVAETRSKSAEETAKEAQEKIGHDITNLQVQLSELSKVVTGLAVKLDKQASSSEESATSSRFRQGNPLNPHPFQFTRLSKIDFPKFCGEDVESWLFRCEQFFTVDQVDNETKVLIASIHLEGRALQWHQSLVRNRPKDAPNLTWENYVVAIKERFGSSYEDPMAELKALNHTSTVQEYMDAFDAILCKFDLDPKLALSCFTEGLRKPYKTTIRLLKPTTIHEAYVLAKLKEEELDDCIPVPPKSVVVANSPSKNTSPSLPTHTPISPSQKNTNHKLPPLLPLPTSKPNPPLLALPYKRNSPPPFKNRPRMSTTEMEDKRAKGICFWCDEKYSREHVCKNKKQLYYIAVSEDELSDLGDLDCPGDELESPSSDYGGTQASLCVLCGNDSCQTLRVTGVINKKQLSILVDSGSTHNFMDLDLAKKLGIKLTAIAPFHIAVADGGQIQCGFLARSLRWRFQNTEFEADFFIVPLPASDAVLGIQWLKTLGEIKCNFDLLTMEFMYHGQRHVLRGAKPSPIKASSAKHFHKLIGSPVQLAMIHPLEQPSESESEFYTLHLDKALATLPSALQQLLQQYEDVFAEPQGLPPSRPGHDHSIPLKSGSEPINKRPYRYPLLQKDAIENLTQELLDNGVIQPSTSPYASPVVLVKKKDGSWRMCVDYRELNSQTIKDKFPIPLIEELLDELHGSIYFTKIDLRSGFHQIRLAPPDIYKTAFRTHHGHYEYLVMPFGLTNAPSTFQSLMNDVFKPYLRKFVLVFFDDILIYSHSWQEHLEHLEKTLQIMREHCLFAKLSKCVFAANQLEYLGHIISGEGVSTEPSKILAVQNWPIPKNLKQLRGFLGLTGYYRRFVKSYGQISKPLTQLLKKNNFGWSEEAQLAFDTLKQAMTSAPVLALPDFNKTFIIETDASGGGIGAVLMQQGHPIAYISKALAPKHQAFSAYERELLAIMCAVSKWGQYLMDREFIIRTDHQSLKHLLEQKIHTPLQQKWLAKLLGFNYRIEYKRGSDNQAADALSRLHGADLMALALSQIHTDLLQKIQHTWLHDPTLTSIIKDLQNDPNSHKHYTWSANQLRRKGRLVVGQIDNLQEEVISLMHSTPQGGHSGMQATYKRLQPIFYWKGMKRAVEDYVRCCHTCQQCKYDTSAYPGLLQPLPIPTTVWTDISLDFIEGLPKSMGFEVILVVVDRLSKYGHFLALHHPYTALDVAQLFFDHVYKLHGMPQSIVSDRDSTFLSTFWQELFVIQGTSLNMSTSYHPQSDGQTEVLNRCLETYLRCFCHDKPTDWCKWLPVAEYWYNTSFQSAIRTTPYEVLYGQPPPIHLPYLPGESKVELVDRSLQAREEAISVIRENLARAQNRMTQQANKNRSERSFEIGEYVYLKLQPYRQQTVENRGNPKIAKRFYGPYKIIDRVGKVAYKLALPPGSKIHPTFHVSLLKRNIGNLPASAYIPSVGDTPGINKIPEAILDRQMVRRQGRAATKVLVQWQGHPPEDATWEYYYDLKKKFPHFDS